MAVEHIVWVKFNDGVSEEKKAELVDGLKGLESKVPGIERFTIGKNFTDRAKGFGLGFVVTLESKEALKVYAEHPEHVKVAVELKANAELMAMDYEF
ncbi:Stress responsive A/B Barrel Domain protein [Poriferisphaera corsica]|uniref:Stress responsive A/B Barrel Domain protein n=1 Tax=Poriferisphaera corsica TaxID=2528020 RepID=A0A517YYX5_9BACT|nr:Dabb family protein [Poriferisphaera corsica]QDU35434.1 Stress responsive A/B Barrel Domain protein [Poriferisphaera corsica]